MQILSLRRRFEAIQMQIRTIQKGLYKYLNANSERDLKESNANTNYSKGILPIRKQI